MKNTKVTEELLEVIKEAKRQYPDLRLCQLLSNAVPGKTDLYYVEDHVLLHMLKKAIKEWRNYVE